MVEYRDAIDTANFHEKFFCLWSSRSPFVPAIDSSMDIARSSLKLFISKVAAAAISFLGITLFARELDPATLGVFFLFEASLGMLTIPADFGLRGAVEKRISEGESPSAFLGGAFVLKLGPLAIITLGIFLFRSLINNYIGADVAHLLAVAIVLQEIAMLATVVLTGELRVGETAALGFARQVTWFVVATILITYGFGSAGLIYGLLAGLLVLLFWGWYKTTISISWPSREHIVSLLDYSKYNAVSSIGGYFYSWMDVAIIGLFLTQAHVGAYELAWRVTAVSILFSGAISTTIFPQVSQWETEGAKEHIEKLLPAVMTPSLLLVIPAFFGTLLFSREILGFVFGVEYVSAWLVLVLLMGDKVFQAIQVIIGRSLQAIDKPDLAARATVVSVVLNAVLNVVFVLEYGIIGAAFATVISSLANDVLHFSYLRRFIKIRFPLREILECVVASVGMAVVLLLITRINQVDSLIELLLIIGVGIVVYSALVFLSPTLGTRVQETIGGFGTYWSN